jgi:hypothetical protein
MKQITHRMTKPLRRLRRDARGRCSACERILVPMETQHVGYDADRKPICVGDCCRKMVAETAVRFAYMPPAYEVPPDDTILWRCTDFVKFTSLLATKGLYFTRGDRFDDPFEGAMGAVPNRPRWDRHYLDREPSSARASRPRGRGGWHRRRGCRISVPDHLIPSAPVRRRFARHGEEFDAGKWLCGALIFFSLRAPNCLPCSPGFPILPDSRVGGRSAPATFLKLAPAQRGCRRILFSNRATQH